MFSGSTECFGALIFDSPMDWLVVLLIVLIFFGGRRIPEVMRGLGEGIRSFKDGVSGKQEPPANKPSANTENPVEQKK